MVHVISDDPIAGPARADVVVAALKYGDSVFDYHVRALNASSSYWCAIIYQEQMSLLAQ